MNRTDRLLAIVLELQAKGWQRAEDLARTFEISKRTMYRDLQALSEAGVPIVSVPGQGYSLVEDYFLPPLSFSADEALVLILGSDFVGQTFDEQYRKTASSATSKIQAVLPERLQVEVRALQHRMRMVAVDQLSGFDRPQLLQEIRSAIIHNRRIRFVYHSRSSGDPAGEVTERDADPYGLVHYSRAWYISAYCHLRQGLRNFRLDRIDQLKVLDVTFLRPPDFRLGQAWDNSRTVKVRAHFSPQIMRWVREEPSFFQVEAEEREDGLLLTFMVRDERELLQWLMSWGSQVQVLEPESLRRLMCEEAEAILQNHKTADSLLP
jgi:predicted DNA-binding transcriptional regulator YafY